MKNVTLLILQPIIHKSSIHFLKILEQILQNLFSVYDHFWILGVVGLIVSVNISNFKGNNRETFLFRKTNLK